MQPLFAYFDETAFDDARAYGYGMLLTDEPVQATLIDGALADLQRDPDFDAKLDGATLSRRYFHASEDSKNAHSALCRRIVASVQGEFFYATTRSDQPSRVIRYAGIPTSEDHYDMMLTDNFIRAIVRARQVQVVVEERGNLTKERVARMFEGIVAHLERSAARLTFIPFFAPNVVFRTVDKSEPGIQVVDFILWALNRRAPRRSGAVVRTRAGKPCPWVDYLGLKFAESTGAQNSPEKSEVWLLGRPPKYERTLYPDGALLLPEVHDEHWGWAAECIRRVLVGHTGRRLPPHVGHLEARLRELAPTLHREVTPDAVKKAASLFLRLFDTLPLYRDVPKEDVEAWRKLLLLRKVASRFLGSPVTEASRPDTETPHIEITLDISTLLDRKGDV